MDGKELTRHGGLIEEEELMGAVQRLPQRGHVHGLERRQLDKVHVDTVLRFEQRFGQRGIV